MSQAKPCGRRRSDWREESINRGMKARKEIGTGNLVGSLELLRLSVFLMDGDGAAFDIDDPHLTATGIEPELDFVIDLDGPVAWGKNFDGKVWGAEKEAFGGSTVNAGFTDKRKIRRENGVGILCNEKPCFSAEKISQVVLGDVCDENVAYPSGSFAVLFSGWCHVCKFPVNEFVAQPIALKVEQLVSSHDAVGDGVHGS